MYRLGQLNWIIDVFNLFSMQQTFLDKVALFRRVDAPEEMTFFIDIFFLRSSPGFLF